MSSVVDALRTTPKGQLSYSRILDTYQLKEELDLLSSPPLPHHHTERDNSLNDSFGLSLSFNLEDFNENSCLKSESENENSPRKSCKNISQALSEMEDEILEVEEENDDSLRVKALFDTSLPVLGTSSADSKSSPEKKHVSSCPVSPQFGITTSAILDEESMWDSFGQLCVLKRLSQFDAHERALSYLMKSKQDVMEQKLQRLVEIRDDLVKQKQDECSAKTRSKLQRLKEDHQEHVKRIHTKQQEIARHKEKLEEEGKQRQERETARVKEMMAVVGEIQTNRDTFVEILNGCPIKARLSDLMEKYRLVLDKVCANMNQQMSSSGGVVTEDQLSKAHENRLKSQKAVTVLKAHIADAEVKVKDEQVQKQLETQQKAEEQKLVAEAAQDLGVQSLAYVLKEHQAKAALLAQMDKPVQAFIANVNMKKFRFDLQRAVNTPINAISPVNGAHLRDKLKRLHALLVGQPVEVGGKQVSLNNSQEGHVFCQNLVARMLVRKGEEQVTSNHESAFAIASVIVGLWVELPVVGDLFLAHLQATCPYILPLYNTRKEGQSTEDYHRAMGYKTMEDGTVEEQDKFLHRMSGLMHLYCACMVTSPPPKGPGPGASPHPLGVDHAWMWLARTLNMEPQPDVTASMIYDLLTVTGHFLLLRYRNQFLKVLHIVYRHYLPKLKSVSVTKSTVGRLEIFLETTIQNNGRIDPPKGLLPPNFLLS